MTIMTTKTLVKVKVILGTQPLLKMLANGKRMTTFFAMETEPRTNLHTKWFRVIAWDKLADSAARNLQKGKTTCIEGEVISQEFKTRNGAVKIRQVLILSKITQLDTKNKTNG